MNEQKIVIGLNNLLSLFSMQKVYYKRIKTWLDYPDHHEICEDYITYGLSRNVWVEICRTEPQLDMKARHLAVAEALKVKPEEIELVKK